MVLFLPRLLPGNPPTTRSQKKDQCWIPNMWLVKTQTQIFIFDQPQSILKLRLCFFGPGREKDRDKLKKFYYTLIPSSRHLFLYIFIINKNRLGGIWILAGTAWPGGARWCARGSCHCQVIISQTVLRYLFCILWVKQGICIHRHKPWPYFKWK